MLLSGEICSFFGEGWNELIKKNFLIDQNFGELNYNEIGSALNFDPFKIDFSYLQEDKHIGEQEYFKTKLNYNTSNNGLVSFETKRNLITNSFLGSSLMR